VVLASTALYLMVIYGLLWCIDRWINPIPTPWIPILVIVIFILFMIWATWPGQGFDSLFK
jgi:hypothetical protein